MYNANSFRQFAAALVMVGYYQFKSKLLGTLGGLYRGDTTINSD